MPLKERSGKLLREFININYKVINSQLIKCFSFSDLQSFISPLSNQQRRYHDHGI